MLLLMPPILYVLFFLLLHLTVSIQNFESSGQQAVKYIRTSEFAMLEHQASQWSFRIRILFPNTSGSC